MQCGEVGPNPVDPRQIVLAHAAPQVQGHRADRDSTRVRGSLDNRRNWSSESESPGSIGATRTPQETPASVSRRSAARRCSGGGVPGSLSFHTERSRQPTEKLIATSVRAAALATAAESRRMRVDFVKILNGFRACDSISIMPLVR